MLQDQLIEEIKQIPHEKLAEIYDLIHYFRLGLNQEKSATEIKQDSIEITSISATPLTEQHPLAEKSIKKGVRMGSLAGKGYKIPDDFDAPLDDLKDYM